MKGTPRTFVAIGLFFAPFSAQLSPLFAQGSLTPPAGTPAPVFKTLQQIEPRIDLQNAPSAAVDTTNGNYQFVINQPGSYYLSANLVVTKAHGILISSANVTLDLNGFEISRSSVSGNGIEIAATGDRSRIGNGTIKSFGSGILDNGSDSPHFYNLAVTNANNLGIQSGSGAIIEKCRVSNSSGTYGIITGGASSIIDCVLANNSVANAINTGAYCLVNRCTVSNNTAAIGIGVDQGSTVSDCTASNNTSTGQSSAGIGTAQNCTIIHCTASSNHSTAGTLTGLSGVGISAGGGGIIQNCTASDNTGDGIRVFEKCFLRDNQCEGNGAGAGDGAGIHVGNSASGSDCRIESNNVTNNDRGIQVEGPGNIIVKNTASGNGPTNNLNYVIAADNRYGPILNITATGTATVNGNNALGTMSSSDPWANFSY